jgi:hypothetical protein
MRQGEYSTPSGGWGSGGCLLTGEGSAFSGGLARMAGVQAVGARRGVGRRGLRPGLPKVVEPSLREDMSSGLCPNRLRAPDTFGL